MNRRAVLLIAAVVGIAIVFKVGVQASRGPYAGAGWLATLVLLGVDGLIAWHVLRGGGAAAIRRGALISVLATAALVGNCSATGLSNGLDRIAAAPTAYATTILLLVGPLLLLLAIPGFIALAAVTPSTGRWILVSSLVGGFAALLTAYAGFVLSTAVLCRSAVPSAVEAAQCTAGGSSLAAVFGVMGPAAVLPPLFALMGWRVASAQPPAPPLGPGQGL